MIKFIFIFIFLIVSIDAILLDFNQKENEEDTFQNGFLNSQEALFLSPYLERGEIEVARSKSEVKLKEYPGLKSYSGFFSVNKKECGSNVFFWFFPAEKNYENVPIVEYFNGGPGGSSIQLSGISNSPIHIVNGTPFIREFSWYKKYSVLYIDHPVGTGYSFTENENCYATNSFEAANDTYEALVQFFKLFPELRSNEFYLCGISYGGKYVPPVAYKIHQMNPKVPSNEIINLKGVLIESGWSDPINQVVYADFMYEIGLIDEHLKEKIENLQDKIKELIKQEKYVEAFDVMCKIFFNNDSIFIKDLGLAGQANWKWTLVGKYDDGDIDFTNFLLTDDTRVSMHVGNQTFLEIGVKARENIIGEFMVSVAHIIKELLSNYRMIFFNGQLDLIVAYPTTNHFLNTLDFSGKDEFLNAERHIWRVDDEVAGYVKQGGNVTQVLVRNAGHLIGGDQPKWVFDLITNFIENKFPK